MRVLQESIYEQDKEMCILLVYPIPPPENVVAILHPPWVFLP